MVKKGQVYQSYTEEFKVEGIRAYLTGSESYKVVAERLGITNCIQLKALRKKYRYEEPFDTRRGVSTPIKGRHRTTFTSIEEERDYLKAQVDYLKKRYQSRASGRAAEIHAGRSA